MCNLNVRLRLFAAVFGTETYWTLDDLTLVDLAFPRLSSVRVSQAVRTYTVILTDIADWRRR